MEKTPGQVAESRLRKTQKKFQQLVKTVQKSCVYQCQFRLLKFWNTHTCRRTEVFLG